MFAYQAVMTPPNGPFTGPKHSVLLVSTSYPIHPGSSSGIFVYRLAEALAPYFAIKVVTPADNTSSPNDVAYPVRKFRYAPRRWQILANASGGIPAALSRYKWRAAVLIPPFVIGMASGIVRDGRQCQIILANWSICGVIAGLIGMMLKKPVVTIFRGSDVNRAQASPAHRLLLLLALKTCVKAIAVSDGISTLIYELFPRYAHKIEMIPNGVSIPKPSGTYSDTRRTGVKLAFVGSLIPLKRVDLILSALKELDRGITLEIAGDGPLSSQLKAQSISDGLANSVRFHGALAPEKIPGFLAECDVLVLPSESEGRANVILEAFSMGLPVIASDIPGNRELVVDSLNGYLFPSGDANALGRSILRLKDSSERKRLGAEARKFIDNNNLSWESAALRYYGLLTDVINSTQK